MAPFERIIVIDDDKTVNLICSFIIKKHLPGVEFLSFTQPEDALDYMRETIDNPVKTVVLLDINMPTLSGWDVLEQVSTFGSSFMQFYSIYLFSSSIYYKDREQADANPLVVDFIDKPFTDVKLDAIIAREKEVVK